MAKKLLPVFILIFVMIPGISAQDFFEDTCPFYVPPGEDVTCGYLVVPENRQDANSNDIELLVAIIASTSPNPEPDPIIYLEGGPGGSAIASIDWWYSSALRQERDIILIDQRGTGYSYPSLDCWEINEEEDDDPERACYDRLVDEGIDLSGYTTVENAADIHDLIVTLDYNAVNLYGVSYGTRLALAVLRYHPENLRSVIIDAVFPPQVNSMEEDAIALYNSLSMLFQDCASDAVCNAEFPNLEELFYATLEEFVDEPFVVEDLETEEEVEVYATDFLEFLYQQFYATSIIPAFPAALYAITEGDYQTGYELLTFGADTGEEEAFTMADAFFEADELLYELEEEDIELLIEIEDLAFEGDVEGIQELLEENYDADQEFFDLVSQALVLMIGEEIYPIDDDSEGMYFSVMCNDEISFIDFELVYSLPENAGVPDLIIESQAAEEMFETCDYWDSGLADAAENMPVESDLPVLVLSGQFDTGTPSAHGQLAADHLSNSFHFVFPGGGHGALDSGDCPLGILEAFLQSPTVEPNASCIANMKVEFYIP